MTTRTSVSGGSWTLLITSPIRALLQSISGELEVLISSIPPDDNSSGYIVKQGEWADLVYIDDFGGDLYVRSTGKSSSFSYDYVSPS